MADEQQDLFGLGSIPKDQWIEPTEKELEMKPIDRLAPGTDFHKRTLEYLLDRLKMSENKMSALYPRWQMNEMTLQAYVNLPDWEKIYKDTSHKKEPPAPVTIVIPYAYATTMTICTYLLHVFCGRKPMFQVGSTKTETAQAAMNMEAVLQYNAEHAKMIAKVWQWLIDMQCYGLGVLRSTWKNETAMRTVFETQQGLMGMPAEKQKTRKKTLVYSGNEVDNVDPYMFFPDPRVPMNQVNTKGEFCFWRVYDGKHNLKKLEADGAIKYVDNAGTLPTGNGTAGAPSVRNIGLGGSDSVAGKERSGNKVANFIQVDQGTVEIIPKETGFGKDSRPQKWVFTILNKTQIVQAEPFDLDHGMHPVAVAEPYSIGYGFGQPGSLDFIRPMQEILSWLINSHIANVRAALNNMFVVDPTKVEMKDVTNPAAGKVIRLKPAAYGADVRTVLAQLQVADVTTNHVRDFEMFMKLADSLTGVTDNIRGLQDSGGRKTATEVRTSAESGASRLAAQAMVISGQAMVDLTKQMSLNIQQFMDDSIYLQVVGADGIANPIQISPQHLVGDFQYPINDGTLPTDKIATLDIWKEIFLGISKDPELRQRFDLMKVFKFVAELGGAKNIGSFEMKVLPPGAPPPEGMVPMVPPGAGAPPGGGGSSTPGLNADPSARLQQ